MQYTPNSARYDAMQYRRAGRSGLKLPAVSLGLWHNFGGVDSLENVRAMLRTAFDLGVTHFDLADNYGPPAGSAEANFGLLVNQDWRPLRDELIISTKAGCGMWPGPYGNWGSRKYLLAGLNASLKRMNLDYVDIFYHHRPDPDTPLEETMGALASAVQSGKALYAAISNYPAERAAQAAQILRDLKVPCLLDQPSYSIFNRWLERDGLLSTLETEGVGCIVFSPLAQGMLSDKYLGGIPSDSRAASATGSLSESALSPEAIERIRALNAIARERGQSLAQMALAWCLRHPQMTSVLIGASKPAQIEDSVGALQNLDFSAEELARIDEIAPR